MLALKAGSAPSNPEDEVAETPRQNVRFDAANLAGSATSIGVRIRRIRSDPCTNGPRFIFLRTPRRIHRQPHRLPGVRLVIGVRCWASRPLRADLGWLGG